VKRQCRQKRSQRHQHETGTVLEEITIELESPRNEDGREGNGDSLIIQFDAKPARPQPPL